MRTDIRILLIDNYDSFTYNLVQTFGALGAKVVVYRNDAISIEEAETIAPTHLVISPGPGRPDDAGVSLEMIGAYAEKIPVLGVCLGHQCLVQHFGGNVVRSARLMHGKVSMVHHDNSALYNMVPQPFEAGRYHSLCADHCNFPENLVVSARTDRDEIMGVRHKILPLMGVQFHPESILTPIGDTLIANFIGQDFK